MKITVDTILVIILALLFVDFILACRMIISKIRREDKENAYTKLKGKLISGWITKRKINNISPYLDIFHEAKHIVKLDDSVVKNFRKRLNDERIMKQSFRRLKSLSKIRRREAAVNLGLLSTPRAAAEIGEALLKEKDLPTKLYMANALSDIKHPDSIPVLICSLIGEKKWYREKVNIMIAEFGEKAHEYIPELIKRDELEILDLLVDMAFASPSDMLKKIIFDQIDYYEINREILENAVEDYRLSSSTERFIWNRQTALLNEVYYYKLRLSKMQKTCAAASTTRYLGTMVKELDRVISKSADVAVKYFFTDFTSDKYLHHNNSLIREKSVLALAKIRSMDSFQKLIEHLEDEDTAKSAQIALSEFIRENPEYIDDTALVMVNKKNNAVKSRIATALSGKIEYFIMKINTLEYEYASQTIKEILLLGKTGEFIGFMNNNTNTEIENSLIGILKEVLTEKEYLKEEFSVYLNKRILTKVGLDKIEHAHVDKTFALKPDLIKAMYVVMILILLVFPLIYVARYSEFLKTWPLIKHATTYIIDFNYYLVYYSILINLIYIVIITLSRINITRQLRISKLKNNRMLFKRRMLPSISIIAPAFNEENIIIESANSLLNLKYPDYNLIIVNDGSTDGTLKTLINYYDLERTDYTYNEVLRVAPIRGIYSNPAYPKLLVVDTENAGKADSLNSGVIISDKEYLCCIDADSLLENDALLNLASQTLDESVETPALGGNVFPINGCEVSRGYISEKKIPENVLAKFQTMEYLRAFMSGRLGWAYLNCLLIISGAFGLFRRERVVNVGGFLTQNSKYHKDTVGEDMELVVRISHLMHSQGKKFRINYCYNANCWTEVPEKWSQLRRQRVRWYTGLVETLHFHKKTIFNPRFGTMGMIGMPYYFLFEMIGPLIEVQGYIMVIMAIVFGILSAYVALLLFLASVMLGILVSLVSLLIVESKTSFYDYKDIVKLIGIAIIENFGPRQIFSFWRVVAYFKMLFSKEHTWGEQSRRGFK